MAWSSIALTAQELSDLAADKPLLGELRALGTGIVTSAKWVAGATGTFVDADITDNTALASRAYDGHSDEQTCPNTTGTGFTFLIDFGAAGIELDGFAIMNHDLFSDGCTGLTLGIADSSNFVTNPATLVSINPSSYLSADRRFFIKTDHLAGSGRRYTGVRYVRVGLSYGGAQKPQIGELLFARRRQLSWKAVRPYDDEQRRSESTEHEARSGKLLSYVWRRGKRTIRHQFQVPDATEAAKFTGFWDNTYQGARRFIFIENPGTSPNDFNLVRNPTTAELALPYQGPTERAFSLEADEIGPHFLKVSP